MSKDINVSKILAAVCLGFFGDHLLMTLTFNWESILKVIGHLYCFGSEPVW